MRGSASFLCHLFMRKLFLTGLLIGLEIFLVSSISYALRVSPQAYQRRLQEEKIQSNLVPFEVSPFQVFTESKLSSSLRRGLKKIIRDSIHSIGDHFNYYPKEAVQLSLLDGATYDSIDDPRIVSGGFYRNKKIRMRFDYKQNETQLLKDFERVFRHEYTHLVIASIDGGKTPRWLNEGLAVYEEKGKAGRKKGDGKAFYKRMQEKGTFIPIRDFVKRSLTRQYTEKARDFYENSYVLAKYLVDEYGLEKLRSLFKKMKDSGSFSSAFQQAYDIDLETLAKGAYGS